MEATNQEGDKLKENKVEEEEELITDFSDMFKSKGAPRRMPKLSSKQTEQTPNWLLEIPAKLQLTKEELCQRKVLDQKRWHSMAKTENEAHSLVAAVVSAWNYLFSSKGAGQIPALTVKAVVDILLLKNVLLDPKDQYHRASLVLSIFECLCSEFKVKAQGKVVYKPTQPNKVGTKQQYGLEYFLSGLKTQEKAYILITFNNVLCPIGFDKTPLKPLDAYKKLEDIKEENLELWIINASVQRFSPSFITKRWKHINQCLQTVWPNYIDLDEPKKGSIRHPQATPDNEKEEKGSSCCLIEFHKLQE